VPISKIFIFFAYKMEDYFIYGDFTDRLAQMVAKANVYYSMIDSRGFPFCPGQEKYTKDCHYHKKQEHTTPKVT